MYSLTVWHFTIPAAFWRHRWSSSFHRCSTESYDHNLEIWFFWLDIRDRECDKSRNWHQLWEFHWYRQDWDVCFCKWCNLWLSVLGKLTIMNASVVPLCWLMNSTTLRCKRRLTIMITCGKLSMWVFLGFPEKKKWWQKWSQHIVPVGVAHNVTQPYVEQNYTMPTFEQCKSQSGGLPWFFLMWSLDVNGTATSSNNLADASQSRSAGLTGSGTSSAPVATSGAGIVRSCWVGKLFMIVFACILLWNRLYGSI